MNHDQALVVVYDLLDGQSSIPIRLRMKQNVPDADVEALYDALDVLVDYYAGEDMVPKRLGRMFIDIYGAFSFRTGFYSEGERRKWENVGIKLQEKSTSLFS